MKNVKPLSNCLQELAPQALSLSGRVHRDVDDGRTPLLHAQAEDSDSPAITQKTQQPHCLIGAVTLDGPGSAFPALGRRPGTYFNEHTLLLRNAVSYTEAGKPSLAADLFAEVITAGTLSRRDVGFFNARRSAALALSGEPDEAARIGTFSAEVAQAMKSERTMRVLREVSQTLSRWRSRSVVREFHEALQAV
ncbi:hypothetical protein [Streptomyces sp. NPDC001508]|uniref:hypothetical protein n=1 Tax=Streptomyces sp. NPDC001508 TaxID=3154656 RepID=UPI00332FAE07